MDFDLEKCPPSPNCVSSLEAEDESHKIEPLKFTGTLDEAKAQLKAAFKAIGRTTIVKETEEFWHVEFKSKLIGFIDDVHFKFSKDKKSIGVRSASRVGYSDLGANRKRVEKIRTFLI